VDIWVTDHQNSEHPAGPGRSVGGDKL
jgi:hypothetical protein